MLVNTEYLLTATGKCFYHRMLNTTERTFEQQKIYKENRNYKETHAYFQKKRDEGFDAYNEEIRSGEMATHMTR